MSLILRCQRGFTTVTLMGGLAIGGLLVAAGFAAVTPDISQSRDDQDYKQAYGAAEAGVQWYLASLARDNSFYVKCTAVPPPTAGQPAPVNNVWDGQGVDPRIWRYLPGDTTRYTVELLPAPGFSTCMPNNQYSMIDPSGNMRLRVTGQSRDETRSIIVTLRRRNFLDFVYFTHFDTYPPAAYDTSWKRTWAQTACARFRAERADDCEEIKFPTGDEIRGPLHTNDSIWVCGAPKFGRNSKDSIELNGAPPGYVGEGCDTNPDFVGTAVYPSGQLAMPTSNTELASLASTGYLFKGRTKFKIEGERMDVTLKNGTVIHDMQLPGNGVIYVQSDGVCSTGYSRAQTYNSALACGDAWVKGDYAKDLTIAATNDIVIDGNLKRSDGYEGFLLGLIANNFVRVYHPVTNPSSSNCQNASGALQNPEIHAAILALNHSFLVDNWYCGTSLGHLTVHGAIAQRFRGPVGTGNGASISTGYYKNYEYNDRLRYREPPFFLDPEQSAWRVARQNAQVPATR